MTYMRVTRDQRGYETTYLLHTPRPGERPRVLYWYRTAPGVRVGRRALDEEAIRTIEEQYPDIEFDWPTLLEEAESVEPDVEPRVERPRKRRPPEVAEPGPRENQERKVTPPVEALERKMPSVPPPVERGRPAESATVRSSFRPVTPPNPLLEQLVGREIATRLRARYADVASRLAELPDDGARRAWLQRADALDPDRWATPQSILEGIQHAERLFDELKRELPAAE